MYISEYMTTSPITVSGLTSLPEARQILSEYQIRHLPVIDQAGSLVGILTDRDLRSAYPSSVASREEAVLAFDHVQQSSVVDIMTTPCSSLSMEARLDDALQIFARDKVGAIPVVDMDNKVLGLFSLLDLTSAYGNLFGAARDGVLYFVIEDDGRENIFGELSALFDKNNVVIESLIRIISKKEVAKIYVRVNSLNPNRIIKLLNTHKFRLFVAS
ncbi:MAG: acetoin utilization protein AcuB [Desulfotalea sp.]|nr:MAG: acetoin utilization protein AcuB [Desulfotalea sp.]